MGYVEFLRARRAFIVLAIIIAACLAFIEGSVWYAVHSAATESQQSGHSSHFSVTVTPGFNAGGDATAKPGTHVGSFADGKFSVPLGAFFGFASLAAMILGTILATSLSKENGRGGFAFTKPVARERLALTYFAVDVIAIAAMFAFVMAILLGSSAAFGFLGKIVIEPGAWAVAAAGFGAAVMYYGVLQALTSTRAAGSGLIAGLSWVVFLVLLSLNGITYFGPVFHGLIVALNFFNPLGYYGLRSTNEDVQLASILGFSPAASLAITWTLAVAACGVAIYGWKRVEVQ